MPIGASMVASLKKSSLLDRKTVKAELSYNSRSFTDLSYCWLSHQGLLAPITSSGSQKTGNSDHLAVQRRVLNQTLIRNTVLAVHFFEKYWEVIYNFEKGGWCPGIFINALTSVCVSQDRVYTSKLNNLIYLKFTSKCIVFSFFFKMNIQSIKILLI